MDEFKKYVVRNGDIKYTLSNNKHEFLIVHEVGSKKEELLKRIERFIGVDCPPFEPAKYEIVKSMLTYVAEPLENDKPFRMDVNLFYRAGKWATVPDSDKFHMCRGVAAYMIFKTILGIEFSRKDIDIYKNGQLNTNEIYTNITKLIDQQKNLSIE